MTYNTVATIADDVAFNRRVTAAAAKEGIFDPQYWVHPRRWAIASAPGFDAKWESAVAGGVTDPGADEAVITDADILSAVQALLAAEQPPQSEPEPEPEPEP